MRLASMKTLLVLVAFGFALSAQAQQHAPLAAATAGAAPKQEVEHAPTVEQCQADQRLWISKIEDDVAKDASFYTIGAWQVEMHNCEKVDPPNHWKYYNTAEEASEVQFNRMMKFLIKHSLLLQFVTEDAEGKR